MHTVKHLIFREAKDKRTDIQALRALAVLAVVIYHIYPTRLIGGFAGVDVFFVISGYLMTYTIWKGVDKALAAPGAKRTERLKASFGFLTNFYARRIKRLAPAATLCLLLVLATTVLIGNFSLQITTAPQVFASAIFMQNWFLADQAIDYLGADAGATAVQHFWSLSVEEQFYLIWPLLLLAVGLVVFARTKKHRSSKIVLAVIVIFVAVFFAYGFYLTSTTPAQAYFVTPARIWELAFGGIVVFLPAVKDKALRLLLPWVGIGLIVASILMLDGSGFPGWHALIPVIGTALVIWAGAPIEQVSTTTSPQDQKTLLGGGGAHLSASRLPTSHAFALSSG